MSVELLPGIGSLEPGSLCHSIYTQLYQGFFNAQNREAVTEGDDTSVRLRNTAYGFAQAIAGAVEGGGGTSGVLADYLKLSGGSMSGSLAADYGFGAGIGNRRVLEVFRTPQTNAQGEVTGYDYGLTLTGDLRVLGNHLYIGGQQFVSYMSNLGTMFVRYPKMDFATSKIRTRGDLLFGEDRATGVYISASGLEIAGHGVYHGGNANLPEVDWTMKNAAIAGKLTVAGTLRALYGASLGAAGTPLLETGATGVSLYSDLAFADRFGIKMKGTVVLQRVGENEIRLGGVGGDLLLGGDHTNKVRLLSPVTDIDGDNVLISPYGGAFFPDSLRVRHNYGSELLSTYAEKENEGIAIHQQLRFGEADAAWLKGVDGQLMFCSTSTHDIASESSTIISLIGHIPSTSLRKPLDRISDTLIIATYSGDFILLGNPTEVEGSVGISNSHTRMTDGCLFLTDDIRLQKTTDGIRHYGNATFTGGLSSERFSSGFAGSGWAVLINATTGNTSATFDELTVRKRIRAYEFVVQRTRATNGALWVSDTCSGDSVEKL